MSAYQKSKEYFKNLYLTAIADENLSYEETSFLVKVAQQMGISPQDASDIMRSSNKEQLSVPETESEKLAQLEDVIIMMMVDRKIHEQEYQLCLNFARAIGKDKKTLDQVIMRLIKGK